MRKLSSVFIDIFTHSAAACLYFHFLNVCPASSPCTLSTRSVQTCSGTSAQPSAPQVRVLLWLKASFCDISGVYRDTGKFVSIWITTLLMTLLVTAEDFKPKFLFMFKKKQSRANDLKETTSCDQHGGASVTVQMDNDPKSFHVDRSPDETGSAVLIWLLSWWMFLIVRLFLCWCYCSCKQQQARTGPAIFVRAESVASDKQIVFTLSASHKITNACCVQVTVDKWLLMFILMRKWTGRGGGTVGWQPDIRHQPALMQMFEGERSTYTICVTWFCISDLVAQWWSGRQIHGGKYRQISTG